MKIALDYDETFTVDPEFWRWVIGAAQRAGHEVRIVTIRDERYDRTLPLIELERTLPIIYTRGVAKRHWLCSDPHNTEFVPDVWIDDKPESIVSNSTMAHDGLLAWRAARGEAVE